MTEETLTKYLNAPLALGTGLFTAFSLVNQLGPVGAIAAGTSTAVVVGEFLRVNDITKPFLGALLGTAGTWLALTKGVELGIVNPGLVDFRNTLMAISATVGFTAGTGNWGRLASAFTENTGGRESGRELARLHTPDIHSILFALLLGILEKFNIDPPTGTLGHSILRKMCP